MSNDTPDSATIARDTVFAAVMIVTNGIIGICILVGGLKHEELGFRTRGTTSLLSVLAVLSVLTMVLPNFTQSTPGPTYSTGQLIFASVVCIGLYGILVWAQTKSHRSYFENTSDDQIKDLVDLHLTPTKTRAALSFVGLIMSLIAVVGLAKLLSPSIVSTISWLGAPKAVVGIVIALLVLAPETFAAINSAKTNQLQTSLNLALGSGAASIALTIPAVSVYSIVYGRSLSLGLDPKSIIFLFTTFIAAGFTFASGRTTPLHGIVHLVILVSYIAITFMP
jgi:Ca2+:H+ antiporter